MDLPDLGLEPRRKWKISLPVGWIIGKFLQMIRLMDASHRALDALGRNLARFQYEEHPQERLYLDSRAHISTCDWNSNRRSTNKSQDLSGDPQVFPTSDRSFALYSRITTTLMTYKILRHTLTSTGLMRWLGLECYLAGCYLLDEPIGTRIIVFALLVHLGWRLLWTERTVLKFPQLLMFLYQDYDSLKGRRQDLTALTGGRAAKLSLVFRHILYYRARFGGSLPTVYKLRPNRTQSVHKKLRNDLAARFPKMLLLLVSSYVLLGSIYVYIMASDAHYLSAYPSCTHITGHRLYALLVDGASGLVVITESLQPMVLVPLFIYTFDADLRAYWLAIEARLDNLLNLLEVRSGSTISEESQVSIDSDDVDFWIEDMMIDSQAQLKDFLTQICLANSFMSEVISVETLALAGTYLVITHALSTNDGVNYALPLLGIIVISNLFFSCSCALLLILERRIMRSYVTVCSIIAYDRSRHRRVFMKLCDEYVNRRFAYTCFGYPLTTSALLTFTSWTLSCTVVITTLNLGQEK